MVLPNHVRDAVKRLSDASEAAANEQLDRNGPASASTEPVIEPAPSRPTSVRHRISTDESPGSGSNGLPRVVAMGKPRSIETLYHGVDWEEPHTHGAISPRSSDPGG